MTVYLFAAGITLMLGALRYPWNNWDMIGYAGVVEASATRDPVALHSAVFEGLRGWASPGAWRVLTESDEFRRAVAADPASLQELLPFYRNKPLYTAVVRVMVTAGMDVYAALHLLSALCGALGLWLVAVAFHRMSTAALLALPPVAVLAGLDTVSRLATPDAMAFAGVALAALLMVRRSRALALVLALLPLIRPELLVFSMVSAMWWALRGERVWAPVAALVAGVGFVFTKHLAGGYGWDGLFWFTFARVTPYPTRLEPDVTVGFYLRRVAIGVKLWVRQRELWVALAALVALVWRYRAQVTSRPGSAAALCALATAAVQFLVFPLSQERFIAGAAILLFCAAATPPEPANDTAP
jgi:hypothetical protein